MSVERSVYLHMIFSGWKSTTASWHMTGAKQGYIILGSSWTHFSGQPEICRGR